MPLWWNGIHSRLKICRPVGHTGSSPVRGTKHKKAKNSMPTFEIVPIEEALAATVVDTWLEETFGTEHGSPWESEGFQMYIVSNGTGGVYESILSGKSILFLDEAKELITILKTMGRSTVLFRVTLEEGN
tara:strand:+ start:164 stop:553 length:390 start_codon:yes stop_codon:yes gene_type:complete